MNDKKPKRLFYTAVLLLSAGMLAGLSGKAEADLTAQVRFDIAPQQLPSALLKYSQQSGVQIASLGEIMEGKASAGVAGTLEARSALETLLKRTELEYDVIDANTVAIRVRGVQGTQPIAEAGGGSEVQLVRSESPSPAQGEGGGQDPKGAPRAAASSEAEKVGISEIVVTAQKREERLQDVPIAISVLSGAALDRSTADGVTEALRAVPGVMTMIAAQGGGTQISVRGVSASDALFVGSSTVGYYLDDVPFSFSRSAVLPDANAYDLARVEVLRGPQGTLYGASSLNGVVRILTHEADLNEFELKGRTSISSTERGSENYRGDVTVNVPIISDKLAARAVLGYQDWSGWIDKPIKRAANDAQIATGRFRVNAQPTEQLSIGLSAWFSRSDRGAPDYSSLSDSGQLDVLTDEPITTDYDVYGLTLGYDFPTFSAASTTSFIDYRNQGFLDFGFSFVPPATFGACSQATLPDCVQLETNLNAEVFSQELRLASTGEGPWRWSVGGIYRETRDEVIQLFGPFTAVVPGAGYDISESFAVFSEVTRTFFDNRVELTVGARYFEDKLEQGEIYDFSLNYSAGDGLYRTSNTFQKTTPRVVLSWHVNEDLTTYASYAEGFRSGQDQNEVTKFLAPDIPAVDPDTLHNYEWGVRGSSWEGRLDFDAAVYYIDWEMIPQGIAIPYSSTFITVPVNGGSASGMGFEFGTTVEPVDGLTLGLNFSWNDLAFDQDIISQTADGPVVVFAAGDRPNLSPKYTAGATGEYQFPLGSSGFNGRLWGAASYIAEQYARTFQGTVSVRSGDPFFSARAGFSIDSNDSWSATLFADNIAGEDRAYLSNTPGTAIRARPRTIGLQVEFRY